MTRSEWLASEDAGAMLRFALHDDAHGGPLGFRVTDRKLRLFACACCRLAWPATRDPRSRFAVEVAEAMRDGEPIPSVREQVAAFRAANFAYLDSVRQGNPADAPDRIASLLFRDTLQASGHKAVEHVAWRMGLLGFWGDAVAARLRDVVNPLAPSDGLHRPSPDALAVAGRIDADGTFDELPVLADALEDGGCADAAILDHLRSRGPHVRGCWALDLILGRD